MADSTSRGQPLDMLVEASLKQMKIFATRLAAGSTSFNETHKRMAWVLRSSVALER